LVDSSIGWSSKVETHGDTSVANCVQARPMQPSRRNMTSLKMPPEDRAKRFVSPKMSVVAEAWYERIWKQAERMWRPA